MTIPKPEWRGKPGETPVPWCQVAPIPECSKQHELASKSVVPFLVCQITGARIGKHICTPAFGRLVEALEEIERRSSDPRAPPPAGVAFPMHCLEGINELARAALPPEKK